MVVMKMTIQISETHLLQILLTLPSTLPSIARTFWAKTARRTRCAPWGAPCFRVLATCACPQGKLNKVYMDWNKKASFFWRTSINLIKQPCIRVPSAWNFQSMSTCSLVALQLFSCMSWLRRPAGLVVWTSWSRSTAFSAVALRASQSFRTRSFVACTVPDKLDKNC